MTNYDRMPNRIYPMKRIPSMSADLWREVRNWWAREWSLSTIKHPVAGIVTLILAVALVILVGCLR
jgi:hypothetical protein